MNWNWFPINVAEAIQQRMYRRRLLDAVRIPYQARQERIDRFLQERDD